ncbi:hypothetical protein WHZ77_10855 [Bradyrhizobium sp. A5]|uniref:hypothetical protein n=1 Tax=Bradyrhizobium sp. A5 TaxID=3133696 RepID=UPI003251099A
MIVDQIYDVISQDQSCIDVGICLQKVEHDRLNVHSAEHDRCRDDEMAPRRTILARGSAFGVLDLIENASARRDIG